MKEQADRANDFIDFIAQKSNQVSRYKQYKIKTTETQFHSFVFRQ